MIMHLNKVLVLCLLSGCAIAPSKVVTKLAPSLSSAPVGLGIPTGDRITYIGVTSSNVTLVWNSNINYTIDGSPNSNGPWSAITNLTAMSVVLPRYESNKFYRLNKSGIEIKKTVIGNDIGPFVGNNYVSFIVNDKHWSVSAADDLVVITNDVITRFPITAPGMPPCVPLSAAVDVENKRFYTLEGGCYYGSLTGPYTFREWELQGGDGYFTNITALNQFTFGAFGDHYGDMIRLQSGGIAVQWKSGSEGYCFKYRNPAGVWKDNVCYNIAPYSSLMTLGQHPNGVVYGLIVRDSVFLITGMFLVEFEDNLFLYEIKEDLFPQEGEISQVVTVPDYGNNILFASRTRHPFYFFKTGESAEGQFRKGSSFGVAKFDHELVPTESPLLPDASTNLDLVLNFSEPISAHAAVLANDKLWIIRQEFNPTTMNFDLVYAQPYSNDSWGERFFISQAVPHSNYRGGAVNNLVSYRNSSLQPNRILFLNADSDGQTCMFEIKIP